jgi:hypothetical protein
MDPGLKASFLALLSIGPLLALNKNPMCTLTLSYSLACNAFIIITNVDQLPLLLLLLCTGLPELRKELQDVRNPTRFAPELSCCMAVQMSILKHERQLI